MKKLFKILSQDRDREFHSLPVLDSEDGRLTNSLIEQLQERGHRIATVVTEEQIQRVRERNERRRW